MMKTFSACTVRDTGDFTSFEYFFITPIESCGSISEREGNCHEKNQTASELAETKKKVFDTAVDKFYGSFLVSKA